MKTEPAVMYVIPKYLSFNSVSFNNYPLQSELLVRLADGPDSMTGRVELRQSGIWGTICDDDFGVEEATVIDCIFIWIIVLSLILIGRLSAEC